MKNFYKPSGISVLIITSEKTKTAKHNEKNKMRWGRLIIEMCQKFKMNVILSNIVNRHGSKGSIYSFGNQGMFKKV